MREFEELSLSDRFGLDSDHIIAKGIELSLCLRAALVTDLNRFKHRHSNLIDSDADAPLPQLGKFIKSFHVLDAKLDRALILSELPELIRHRILLSIRVS